jgi:HK97 family phage major capsid protein
MLQELIKAKQAVLAVETDTEKQKAITNEIMELTKQLGAEELKTRQEKAKQEKAQKKTELATSQPEQKKPKIEVGIGDEYKGHKMKAILNMFNYTKLPTVSKNRLQSERKIGGLGLTSGEMMAKVFIDLWERGMSKQRPLTKAAMQEGTDSEGGYLAFPEYRAELLAYIRDQSIALNDCRVIPMTTDVMYIPAELTKVSVAVTGEESQATESEPTFSQVSLDTTRIDAWSRVSNELIQDASIPGSIVSMLMEQFVEALGQKVDSCVFLGTGSPVSGVFLSTGYSEVFSSGSTNFSELLESNIRNVIADIRPNRRGNAKFYMANSVLWSYVRNLKDSNNNYLFYESRSGGGAPNMLWGYPIREGNDDIMKSTSAADTAMAVFGDLLGFVIGERLSSVDLIVDPYTRSSYYQTNFCFFTRWAFAHALANYYSRIVTAAS